MQPRQSLDTVMPVLPNFTISMMRSFYAVAVHSIELPAPGKEASETEEFRQEADGAVLEFERRITHGKNNTILTLIRHRTMQQRGIGRLQITASERSGCICITASQTQREFFTAMGVNAHAMPRTRADQAR